MLVFASDQDGLDPSGVNSFGLVDPLNLEPTSRHQSQGCFKETAAAYQDRI